MTRSTTATSARRTIPRRSTRHLVRLVVTMLVGITGMVVFAPAAHAFPQGCRITDVYYGANREEAYSRCSSGTGTHRLVGVCSNGETKYGPWRNTGSGPFRASWVSCIGIVQQHLLVSRWMELRG
jgi:hypothetical protein